MVTLNMSLLHALVHLLHIGYTLDYINRVTQWVWPSGLYAYVISCYAINMNGYYVHYVH